MISTDSVMGATSHQHSLRMRINRTIQQKRGSAGAPNVWTGILGVVSGPVLHHKMMDSEMANLWKTPLENHGEIHHDFGLKAV